MADKGYSATSIADVDQAFGGTNPYASKQYDVRLNTPNTENIVFIEFKSIKRKGNVDTETAPAEKVDNETDDTKPGVDGKGIDVEQLLGYLADRRTVFLKDIRYVLNAKKLDPDNKLNADLLAKQKMQLVFKNNVTLIFNALKLPRIQQLFGSGILNIAGFINATKDYNNPIYNFVISN